MNNNYSLNPIQLPSVADVAYGIIRQQILHGQLQPNQQLNLSKLETELDISRTPLKMALARLQTEGLVQIHPRRGTYISRFSARDIRDCFELRIALEAQALRSAFEARNASLAQEIIDLFVEMDGYFQSEREWLAQNPDYMRLDQAAHIKMVQFSSNSRLLQAYENANVQGYIAVMGSRFAYADVLKTKAEHRNILKALHVRDLDKLLHTARVHLERAGERAVIRLTQEDDAS